MNDIKNPRTLSKSRFKSALECPTKLYYYGKKKEYANQMAENEFMMALAEGGFQIGELAKYSHPCCTEIGHCGLCNYIGAICLLYWWLIIIN